jgi:pyruvate dehydrogenase E2 component (dihydrolipoyllysine-residue acetyltransferase)
VATQVTMPVLGLTMEEGTVAEWLKQEGEAVKKDEPLLTVEMDKGTVEVPAPASGVLRRIVVQPGTTVPVRTLIAEIGEPGEVIVSSSPAVSAAPSAVSAAPMPTTPSVSRGEPVPQAVGGGRRQFASPRARMRAHAMGVDLSLLHGSGPHGRIVEADVMAFAPIETRVLATPLARRLAQEHGVSIDDVRGTGPGGRITQDDVLAAATRRADTVAAEVESLAPAASVAAAGAPEGGVEPLSRVRRITAERMAASSQTTARVTLMLEADFSEASRFRQQLQPEFARLGVPKLPWDALIARAAALALAEHRRLLAQWVEGEGLRRSEDVHVGVAVALEPEGLVVPVLRDADTRSLRELAADLLALADKARAGRLSPAEMQGGTFSITNLGAYRVDGFTPILNPPETAILGVGRIADKPVVVDGQVVARTMCTLSLSFDHRVVDGAPAAAFLARLVELLERPYALLGI